MTPKFGNFLANQTFLELMLSCRFGFRKKWQNCQKTDYQSLKKFQNNLVEIQDS